MQKPASPHSGRIPRAPKGRTRSSLTRHPRTLLEHGRLPITSIARLAAREGRRPRPIYGAHKWFARRMGVVFRSLLVSANLEPTDDFWDGYYGGCNLEGKMVMDPFVGGGTSVVEARRLGANCIGVDVDPVACAVTSFELDVWDMPRLEDALAALKKSVGSTVRKYHMGRLPSGDDCEVLHHFWVQAVDCPTCQKAVHAHPHYILAEDATTCWYVCAHCGGVERRRAGVETATCGSCGERTSVRTGFAAHGLLTCPHCSHSEPLIEIARRERKPPEWHMFAQEVFAPCDSRRSVAIADRHFVQASDQARKRYAAASTALSRASDSGRVCLPDAPICSIRRADDRITAYGYRSWLNLFNDRQKLHLGLLKEAIASLPAPLQRPLAVAYSNHLTTNCMMASYAAGWRRLTPLFSVRAFRHIQRPVEINPWVDGTGRGSFPNCVRKLIRAHEYAISPKEPRIRGGFREVPAPHRYGSTTVLNRSSAELSVVPNESVDVVLTDPPYFDNINYSELSEFFAPWMKALSLMSGKGTRAVLAQSIVAGKTASNGAAAFTRSLGLVFAEMRRVLKPDGLVVFTFRHTHSEAWNCLGAAIRLGGLAATRVFPMPGEAGTGLHTAEGTGLWDAVFVLRRTGDHESDDPLTVSRHARLRADRDAQRWLDQLRKAAIPFTSTDVKAIKSALLVKAALKPAGRSAVRRVQLIDALASV